MSFRQAAFAALALTLACDSDPARTAGAGTEPPTEERAVPTLETAEDARPALIFLGDSLTAGRGLARSEAVPALIQRHLEAAQLDYRSINAGRSGDTTAGGLARLDWYLDSAPQVAGLVIGLGSNDAMRGLPIDAMEANLRAIIAKMRERFPDAKVFLWELETFPNLGAEYGRRYAEVFPRVARSTGAQLIPFPLADVAGRPEHNQADGIHPTREGTELVAARIWASLRAHLESRGAAANPVP